MKKIFLSALLLASASLHSQELDEAYLASLPESVRDDEVNKIPRKVISRDSALVTSIWAPIVSALALSITSLSVLDNK